MMYGWVMAPESIWSRVNATGPRSLPSRTAAFAAPAKRVRSPCPSQAMRAGKPWIGTWRRASPIQSVILGHPLEGLLA